MGKSMDLERTVRGNKTSRKFDRRCAFGISETKHPFKNSLIYMNTKELDGYLKFLAEKQTAVQESGFDVEDSDLSPQLFPFQKYCVKRALKVGRFAMFEDCGLGKTYQQLEWAQQVVNHINKPVLILAPLGVIGQTIKEGVHFGYKVTEIALTTFDQDLAAGIYITNYDNMDNIDAYLFGGGRS